METKPDHADLVRELDGAIRPLASMEGMEKVGEGVVTASVQMLSKMVSKYDVTKVTIQQMQRNLYDKSPDGDAFLAKYEELKAKGTPGLERFLMVISRIMDDEQMVSVLSSRPRTLLQQPSTTAVAPLTNAAVGVKNPRLAGNDSRSYTIHREVQDHGPMGKENYQLSSPLGTRGERTAVVPKIEGEGHETDGTLESMSDDGGDSDDEEAGRSSQYIEPICRRRASQIKDLQLPSVPLWSFRRPYLTGEHLWLEVLAGARLGGEKNLATHKPSVQELIIMDDLLYTMMGIQGRYIQARVGGGTKKMEFVVDPSFDAPMQELVKLMLPICECVAELRRFVVSRSRFEFGMVSQALCAELYDWLHCWETFIAQLEKQLRMGHLSLQGLWFYTHPYLTELNLLSQLTFRAFSEDLVGVGILNMLHTLVLDNAGCDVAHSLLVRLVKAAAVPYFKGLELWIYEGMVVDPYAEFMIVQDLELQKESLTYDLSPAYWQQHYTLREETPKFLDSRCQDILTTGKYLNAIRECGKQVVFPVSSRVNFEYDLVGQSNNQLVDAAFEFANEAFMSLLINDYSLMDQLRSLKHYFLLEQGDFLIHFLDISEEELLKPAKRVSCTRLQSLLEMALRTSSATSDPFHEYLTCKLERLTTTQLLVKVFSTQTQLRGEDWDNEAVDSSGIEMFTLDYRIDWPLSLVISRRSLTRYQLLFRHLLNCKYIERELCKVWQTYQSTRKWAEKLGKEFCTWYSLSQQMLLFFQNYLHYITFEVLEPNWHKMEQRIATEIGNVDDLIRLHEETLDTMMKESLLFRPKVLKRLGEIKATCVEFAVLSEQLSFPELDEPPSPGFMCGSELKQKGNSRSDLQSRDTTRLEYLKEVCQEDYRIQMEAVENVFTTKIRDLVSDLRASAHLEQNLEHLVERLNFNGYYGE